MASPHSVRCSAACLLRLFAPPCAVLRPCPLSVVGPAPGVEQGETPRSVLDVEIDNLDKRLGLCLGGKEEVAVFNRFMFGA